MWLYVDTSFWNYGKQIYATSTYWKMEEAINDHIRSRRPTQAII
jgi:hypothetical protein